MQESNVKRKKDYISAAKLTIMSIQNTAKT